MLGQWIDGLSEEERDRIVRGERWDSGRYFTREGEPSCILSHAYGWGGRYEMDNAMEERAVELDPIWGRFDRLADRFGLDRVVRAIKKRAAKGNRPVDEPVEVAGVR